MDYVTIGQIIKAQGIKGEVKVKALTDDISRFKKLKLVYIGEKPYQILTVRLDSGYAFLTFSGIADRNGAELLKDKMITIDKVNAVTIEEGAFFISDIVGCKLFDEEENLLGDMTEVLQLGAADVFVAKCASGKFMRFPFLKRVFVLMDTQSKRLVVNKKLLDEVCVYDD